MMKGVCSLVKKKLLKKQHAYREIRTIVYYYSLTWLYKQINYSYSQ